MTDKNLKISFLVDPKGLQTVQKHIQQLSKEGIGLSKAFAGISFGTKGGDAQFMKQISQNKSALKSLGDSGKEVARIFKDGLSKEIERQTRDLDKLDSGIKRATDAYEKLQKQIKATTDPKELERLQTKSANAQRALVGQVGARQSTAESVAGLKSREGTAGGGMWGMAGAALMIGQAVAQAINAGKDVLSQGASVNQRVQAEGTQVTARLAQGALHGDISDMIALSARTRNITGAGTKTDDPEGVFQTARQGRMFVPEHTAGRTFLNMGKNALGAVSGNGLNEGAADNLFGAEREKGGLLESAMSTGRVLKAHEIEAYGMMKAAAFGRVSQARRYGGMGGVKSWFGHGFGEGGSMALQAAYSDVLGNSRMLSGGEPRNAALRMAKIGMSSGAGAGLLQGLTASNGGDVRKGVSDLEQILGRAFSKGLKDPQFLDQFAQMVAGAAYGAGGAADAKTFSSVVGDMLGKNPNAQRMANVRMGVAEGEDLFSGRKGGGYFRVADFSNIKTQLADRGVSDDLATNILANANMSELMGGGSDNVKVAMARAGITDKREQADFLKGIKKSKIATRVNVWAGSIGGSTQRAWEANGGDLGAFMKNASKIDKDSLASSLKEYFGVSGLGSSEQVLKYFASEGGGFKGAKGVFRGAGDKGGSTELSIATHIESMAREADKLVKGIDVEGFQKQQKDMWEDIAADAAKFNGNLGPASIAMKALEDSAIALAGTFRALAMMTPEGERMLREQDERKKKDAAHAAVTARELRNEAVEDALGTAPAVKGSGPLHQGKVLPAGSAVPVVPQGPTTFRKLDFGSKK